jgi:hypothetical protein
MSTLRTVEPSLRSIWLGRHLRALREDRGLMLRYVERMAGLPFAEIRAVERGEHTIQVEQVGALLELYGVRDLEEREVLLDLARDVCRLRRWEGRPDAPPFRQNALDYLWLESRAREIRCYSATLVPELLQVPEYAEAAGQQYCDELTASHHASWWAWACAERQRVLDGLPQTLQAVVAEAALRRPPGQSDTALRQQLCHLADVTTMPNVTLHVLPTTAPYLPGMDGSFAVFELFPSRGPVAAVQTLTEPFIHEGQRGQEYAEMFKQLSGAAMDPAASAVLITNAAERGKSKGSR